MSSSLLDAERARATFDPDLLCSILNGPLHKQGEKWEQLFASDPLFDRRNDSFLSREDYLMLATKRSFRSYEIIKANRDILAVHSPVHGADASPRFNTGALNPPSGLSNHFSLFVQTLLSQATKEQQQEWLLKAVNLSIIGTYAQTELGHGSNVRGLETTATYDEVTDEFVLDCPTISAAKWWPGALGHLATHAAIYARLLVKGKDYGFHAFVAQIRDEHHKPLPGVTVGDLGPKMGYNQYDSGYLLVKQLRVPRFSMLARHQHLERGGVYRKAPRHLQKISYFTMLSARVRIVSYSARTLGKSLTIAVRYAAFRKQGFAGDGSKKELAILDHRIIQSRLLPLIATAYAIAFASSELQNFLQAFETVLKKPDISDADTAVLPHLHATASGLKAFATGMGLAGMEEARRCCGGHGYAVSSGFGALYLTQLPTNTYEGDVVPMALQCARYLVKTYQAWKRTKAPVKGPAAYLSSLASSPPAMGSVEAWLSCDTVQAVYEQLAASSIRRAATEVEEAVAAGVSTEQALVECHVALFRCAFAHVLAFFIAQFNAAIQKQRDGAVRAVLGKLCCLFATSRISEISVTDHQLPPESVGAAAAATNELLQQLRPDAVSLVDSFGFTDFQLGSTIGCRNNDDAYEKLVAHARASPLNSPEFQQQVFDELLSLRLSAAHLKESAAAQIALSKL